VWIADTGKMLFCEKELLKTFKEFEKNIVELYDELQCVVEKIDDERGVSSAELICVLGNLLCATARDTGMGSEEFLHTMEISFLQTNGPDILLPKVLH